MRKSNNWTQYMLDLPMEEPPGQRFEYCNGATYLLSAIIQKRTGMRSLKFAKDNLFEPLLPPITKRISGVRYNIESNSIGFTNFILDFGLKKNVAIMEYGLNERQNTVEIGLDGVYRITELPEEKIALKGRWLNENTFKFSNINVGHTEGSRGEFNFIENRADISLTGPYGDRLSLKATRE